MSNVTAPSISVDVVANRPWVSDCSSLEKFVNCTPSEQWNAAAPIVFAVVTALAMFIAFLQVTKFVACATCRTGTCQDDERCAVDVTQLFRALFSFLIGGIGYALLFCIGMYWGSFQPAVLAICFLYGAFFVVAVAPYYVFKAMVHKASQCATCSARLTKIRDSLSICIRPGKTWTQRLTNRLLRGMRQIFENQKQEGKRRFQAAIDDYMVYTQNAEEHQRTMQEMVDNQYLDEENDGKFLNFESTVREARFHGKPVAVRYFPRDAEFTDAHIKNLLAVSCQPDMPNIVKNIYFFHQSQPSKLVMELCPRYEG